MPVEPRRRQWSWGKVRVAVLVLCGCLNRYRRLGGSPGRHLSSHSYGRWKSQIEVSSELVSLRLYGLPWWLSQYRTCLQCRRPGFNPWVGKIPWRREWQPTPVSLPGESHGERSPTGYSSWGCKESDTTEWLTYTQSWFLDGIFFLCLHMVFPVCVCVCVHAHAFVHMFCYNVEKDLAIKLLGRWDKGGGGEESIPKSIRTQWFVSLSRFQF